MPGTEIGGFKAADTIKRKHGRDFYVKIGQKGGKNSKNGGFASQKVGDDGLTGAQRAKLAGSKGGSISKKGKHRVKTITVRVIPGRGNNATN